ncbi:MAG: hypothetical protein AB7E52_04800 [Bdellovibrionales bacterium]
MTHSYSGCLRVQDILSDLEKFRNALLALHQPGRDLYPRSVLYRDEKLVAEIENSIGTLLAVQEELDGYGAQAQALLREPGDPIETKVRELICSTLFACRRAVSVDCRLQPHADPRGKFHLFVVCADLLVMRHLDRMRQRFGMAMQKAG